MPSNKVYFLIHLDKLMLLVYNKTNSISFIIWRVYLMPRNGLNKEKVIKAAVNLIEQSGTIDFSMRALANSLDIKTASLYNHVQSIDTLLVDVCAYALKMQQKTELNAIEGKKGTEGIIALANTYRQFAKDHRELYRLIINTAATYGDSLSEISHYIVEPFMMVLKDTTFTETQKIHWQRVLRGIVHGFVSQEDAGFFSHLPADSNESFQIAIQCYIDGMIQAEKRK